MPMLSHVAAFNSAVHQINNWVQGTHQSTREWEDHYMRRRNPRNGFLSMMVCNYPYHIS